eukprot:256009_1
MKKQEPQSGDHIKKWLLIPVYQAFGSILPKIICKKIAVIGTFWLTLHELHHDKKVNLLIQKINTEQLYSRFKQMPRPRHTFSWLKSVLIPLLIEHGILFDEGGEEYVVSGWNNDWLIHCGSFFASFTRYKKDLDIFNDEILLDVISCLKMVGDDADQKEEQKEESNGGNKFDYLGTTPPKDALHAKKHAQRVRCDQTDDTRQKLIFDDDDGNKVGGTRKWMRSFGWAFALLFMTVACAVTYVFAWNGAASERGVIEATSTVNDASVRDLNVGDDSYYNPLFMCLYTDVDEESFDWENECEEWLEVTGQIHDHDTSANIYGEDGSNTFWAREFSDCLVEQKVLTSLYDVAHRLGVVDAFCIEYDAYVCEADRRSDCHAIDYNVDPLNRIPLFVCLSNHDYMINMNSVYAEYSWAHLYVTDLYIKPSSHVSGNSPCGYCVLSNDIECNAIHSSRYLLDPN